MRAVANLVSCVRNPPFGAPLTLLFYIEIITGIKLDKNNTYCHLKLSMNGVVATLK